MHDLLGLSSVIYFQSIEVLRCAKLELGNRGLLVLLDSNLLSLGKVLLFSPHDLDEFLQVFNFLGLYANCYEA